MTYDCEFCKKVYTSLSSLNYHKKTAKFCLDLQKENNNNIEIKEYTCEYCDKKFTQKSPLISHLGVCNVKNYKDKIDSKIEELKINYEKIITELKFELKLKDEQNKLKDDMILKLEKKLDEKEQHLIKNNEKLTSEIIKFGNTSSQVVNNTNNYTLQFNELKDKMLPFTETNIKDCIQKINGNLLIYFNNNDVNTNFIGYFVKAVKVLTFCTDSSRGSLIIKDEDGNHKKVVASQFVLSCLEKGRHECIEILDKAHRYLEEESEDGNISDVDYAKCSGMLASIKGHILQSTNNDLIKSISSTLIKDVEKIMKNTLLENKT